MRHATGRLARRLAFPRMGRLLVRLLPPAALALCLWLLADRLGQMELGEVLPALKSLSAGQWLAALGFTGISLWALGQYDVVLHRAMGTGVDPSRARAAGMRAMAIAQTVGFGSLSGALVRWRSLPDCDLWQVTRLSVFVSLSFLVALGLLSGIAVLVVEGHVLPAAALAVLVLMLAPRLPVLPGLPLMRSGTALRLIGWTAIDTFAAAAVLWVLLPEGCEIGLMPMIAAYLVALGAGLLSQSPGGVGAFELCLLAVMPELPEAGLLTAMIGYRIVYHLLPALLALALLIRPAAPMRRPALQLAEGAARHQALSRAPQAEWGLAHQGAQILLSRDQNSGWLARRAGGTLAAIGTPLGRPELEALADQAARLGLVPALYKCDAITALRARTAGWRVARIADEAVIDTASWSADRPVCRSLRRKLKAAAKAGVSVQTATTGLPLDEMARIHADWADRSGGERGFSMGRFCPELIGHQRVFLAWQDDRLVAFATFHEGRGEWTLDLMRQESTAPDGTMMALIAAAIAAARSAGVPQLSLAALPVLPGWLPAAISRRITARPGCAGLEQFKRAFGPAWRPLYLAAPGWLAGLRAALEISKAIHEPAPLGREPRIPDVELASRPVQKGPKLGRRPLPLPVFRGHRPRIIDQTGSAHDRRAFPTSRNP
ncbi:phosphatidylglycerol lysyltransferase domain-containing protein [Limimaricola pyoseonensis]|uniref:Phosphatidylglycerol lysyltransferase n=1 Tax=Limimaricola pyoseonensis TaxID=521013 RepID=A0A1G7A5R8_9RHOB|nr:phosphatidylglycerol lysyltransferase domain-containing protein [Limimaricola pyoseonensis]SDE09395.1 phosphatidylglycerol lysyltransferase [Limimaricola pyoseonensis]